jgi:nucleotide-binding universal stress UspA family protein
MSAALPGRSGEALEDRLEERSALYSPNLLEGAFSLKYASWGCIGQRWMAISSHKTLLRAQQGDDQMSIFPTKILLAFDGSREAELAARTAAELANSTNSELHLITVPDSTYHSLEWHFHGRYETYEEAIEAVMGETQKVLDELVQKVEELGGGVKEAHPRIGEPPDQAIIHVAEELGIGLIVMGSRGLGGVRRALMGSISESVVRYAHCPVMIVRPEK